MSRRCGRALMGSLYGSSALTTARRTPGVARGIATSTSLGRASAMIRGGPPWAAPRRFPGEALPASAHGTRVNALARLGSIVIHEPDRKAAMLSSGVDL